MKADEAISVRGVGKRYRLGATVSRDTLRDQIARGARRLWRHARGNAARAHDAAADARGRDEFWALRDINFTVKRGDVLGIIGGNGAGKSTLLKILSQITDPTEGEIRIRGRVASLLEVGTGFHPELSGRENVYLNGAVLGMTRQEIEAKYRDIVSFAEVDRFMDTPVKRYSTGMRVRLGFAVAAHLDPEILLVDEVLAVGDARFQSRCLGQMRDVAGHGRTVLFVSHNMPSIERLCSTAIRLSHGRVADSGTPRSVISRYLQETLLAAETPIGGRLDRQGSGELRVLDIAKCNADGDPVDRAQCGTELQFVLHFEAKERITEPVFCLGLKDTHGVTLAAFASDLTGMACAGVQGLGTVRCTIPNLPIPPGEYWVNLAVSEGRRRLLDRVEGACRLRVDPGDFFGSGRLEGAARAKVLVAHDWRIENDDGVEGGGAAAPAAVQPGRR